MTRELRPQDLKRLLEYKAHGSGVMCCMLCLGSLESGTRKQVKLSCKALVHSRSILIHETGGVPKLAPPKPCPDGVDSLSQHLGTSRHHARPLLHSPQPVTPSSHLHKLG